MSNEDQFQEVLAAFTDRDHHGSASLMEAAKRYWETGLPDISYSLICHGVDIQTQGDPFDFMNKTWTEIYLEVFRRAFYDVPSAKLYGTGHIAENSSMLRMITVELVNEGVTWEPADQFDTSDLPPNVVLLPTHKIRQ
jgi:hypothetical protein